MRRLTVKDLLDRIPAKVIYDSRIELTEYMVSYMGTDEQSICPVVYIEEGIDVFRKFVKETMDEYSDPKGVRFFDLLEDFFAENPAPSEFCMHMLIASINTDFFHERSTVKAAMLEMYSEETMIGEAYGMHLRLALLTKQCWTRQVSANKNR